MIATIAMLLTAVGANHLKPNLYLADTRSQLKIQPSIPESFGDWKIIPTTGGIVSPQQEEITNKIYSETISRTYVNSSGYRVMLMIAYGKNQNDSFAVHKPEVCYPGEGFQVRSNSIEYLRTPSGNIQVHRLETFLGQNRPEPVTYWTTIGDHVVNSMIDKKIEEFSFSIHGYIADGLLFRVSSIDGDSKQAFNIQQSFVNDFIAILSVTDRHRITGLTQ
ncbi:MAG: exosortase-associated protein EpsI, B-type [Leptothrix sp. (in: b-proteobacteria)]